MNGKSAKSSKLAVSTQISQDGFMDFGEDMKRGDSVGLQNYLMYQRLKGEDVSTVIDT